MPPLRTCDLLCSSFLCLRPVRLIGRRCDLNARPDGFDAGAVSFGLFTSVRKTLKILRKMTARIDFLRECC